MKIGRFFQILIVALAVSSQAAAAPFGLSYTGRLTLADGKPMPGPVNLTVKFFNVQTAGTPILTKSINNVTLAQGAFSIDLPLTDTERQTVFDGATETWIQVSTVDATYPRQKFLAVPYALKIPIDENFFKYTANGQLAFSVDPVANRVLGADGAGALTWVDLTGSGLGDMLAGTWDSNVNSKIDEADHAVIADDADDAAKLGGNLPAHYTDAGNIPETATRKWMSDTERTKLSGITAGANMLRSVYDPDNDGKVASAVTADSATTATTATNATQLNGQAASYYNDAGNLTGTVLDARIPAAIARDGELPTAASIATGFAADAVSGDKVDGGTISNFSSTGIDDNSNALAMTIDVNERVGIGTTTPDWKLSVAGGASSALFTTTDYTAGTTGSALAMATGAATGNTFGSLQVSQSGGGGTGNLVLQNAGGNVGIGTTSPTYNLHVVGNAGLKLEGVASVINFRESDQTLPAGSWRFGADGNTFRLDKSTSGELVAYNSPFFVAANQDIYLAQTAGNVGIGTTAPDAKLHVAGDVKLGNSAALCNATTEGSIRYNAVSKSLQFCNGTTWLGQPRHDYILIVDQQAAGVSGGSSVGSTWVTRVLNTEKSDTGANATLAANQVTLGVGKYHCHIHAPSFKGENHKIRLYNVSDAVVVDYGTSEHANNEDWEQTRSHLHVALDLTGGAKTFRVDHIVDYAYATQGFGVAMGAFAEIYSVFECVRYE